MKPEKTSIKWKIFIYLLGFTVILLVILWLFQICYLNTFYKMIKTHEAVAVNDKIISLIQNAKDEDTVSDEIDSLSAENNLAVYVTDTEGNEVYSAEYIANSRMSTISQEQFQAFYQSALDNGGSAKLEYEGSKNKTFADAVPNGNVPEPVDPPDSTKESATEDDTTDDSTVENGNRVNDSMLPNDSMNPNDNMNPADGMAPQDGATPEIGFMQNHGMEMMESVIYVSVVSDGENEYVVMLNSLLSPIDSTVKTLKVQLLWISGIMIALSLGIALMISRKISRPIIKINDSAKKLAKGNYQIEFDGKDYKEIAELSDTLNYTATELDKTENFRRELIANVSHDLRTPLTMIIAYSEVMRDLPGENTPENVQVVIDESKRLTNLVNDMLDISKLQAGVNELSVDRFNLTESIQSVFERYNKLKEQDGYIIEFKYNRQAIVLADEFKIYQVIYNLVNNAINYTGEDKTVTVKQTITGDRVKIEVIDSGAGIPKEDIPYVWDRYYKVDKTHKRAVTGTGLGLSIVKNILEMHHATYGIESEVGKGSTFWFEMKLEDTE